MQIGEEPAYVTREIVYYWLLNIFAKYTNADRFLASTIFISYLLLFISVEKLERARESPNQIIIGILLIASLPILLNNAIQLNKQFLATSLFVSYIALDITQKSLYKLIPLFISIFTHVVILPLFALYLLLKIYNYDGRLVKKIVILISICICFLLSYIFDLFQVNYAVQRILMHENLTHGNPSSMMNIVLFIILGLVCWDSRTTEAVVKGDIIIMQFIVLLVLSLSALTFVGLYMVPMRLFYLVVLMLIVSGSIQRQLYRLNFNLYFSALIIYSAYFMANIHDGPFYFDGGLLNIKN
ncbi:EpsG family protein [Betaproteobacteria bacterium LSUCC0117]|nr:EpsG family protein [Betaproteobacteria bacterium LSUCC0117]